MRSVRKLSKIVDIDRWHDFCDEVCRINDTLELLRPKAIWRPKGNGWVSNVEEFAQQEIIAAARIVLRDADMCGEESEHVTATIDSSGPVWVIDPNDDSSGFRSGGIQHSTAVALVIDHEPVASIVAQSIQNRYFSVFGDEDVMYRSGETTHWRPYEPTFDAVPLVSVARSSNEYVRERNMHFYRRLVAKYGITYVPSVSGGIDVFSRGNPCVNMAQAKIWDLAGPVPMLRRRGGVARHFDGTEMSWSSIDTRASVNPVIFAGSEGEWAQVRDVMSSDT